MRRTHDPEIGGSNPPRAIGAHRIVVVYFPCTEETGVQLPVGP